jgi:hypothetical protein
MAILRIRRGTTTQWAASTKVMKLGELGIDTTLNKIKTGNGIAVWNNLPYINVLPQEFADAIASIDNTLGESYVQVSLIGVADGLATLGPDGKIPDSEIPAGIARDTEVASAVANLVNSAPNTLDTLKELSDALGADANFATTVSTALGDKLNSATAATLYLPLSEPAVDYYITNSGTGSYLVNGVVNGSIHFKKGKKYRIIVNAPGHPFWIQTVSGGYSLANVYSTGVTNSGTDNGRILVELPQSAPDDLYYACQYHSSMAGSISTRSISQEIKDSLDSKSGKTMEYIVLSGTTKTLAQSDLYKIIETTSNSAVTITIPNDADDSVFPVGSSFEARQMGDGRIEFAYASPVVLYSTEGYVKTRLKYSSVMVEKRSTNLWILTGDIDA